LLIKYEIYPRLVVVLLPLSRSICSTQAVIAKQQRATAQSNVITTHNPTSLIALRDPPTNPTGCYCSPVPRIVGNGSCSVSSGTCSY